LNRAGERDKNPEKGRETAPLRLDGRMKCRDLTLTKKEGRGDVDTSTIVKEHTKEKQKKSGHTGKSGGSAENLRKREREKFSEK